MTKPSTSNWEEEVTSLLADFRCFDGDYEDWFSLGDDIKEEPNQEPLKKLLAFIRTLLASEKKKWLEEVLPSWCPEKTLGSSGWNACRDEIIKRSKNI